MSLKLIKKGFTIVELVIVIAVIAVLAGVLIPTFSSLVNKSNESADVQLIRNLNVSLQTDKASNGKHNTLYDANQALIDYGYDITKMNLNSSECRLLWDSVNDVFCYFNGEKVKYVSKDALTKIEDDEKYKYFAIYNEIPSRTEQVFSIYYNGNGATHADVAVGFDAGNSNIPVNYAVDENNNNSVIIRTNGGNLTVNAYNGDITHYGSVNELSVIKVNPDHCYHEYGFIQKLVEIFPEDIQTGIRRGKFIAEDAKFAQTEAEIKDKINYKNFENKKSVYEQHYFGEHNENQKCQFCQEANPEHVCVAGVPYIENNQYKIDCTICGENLLTYDLPDQGSNTDVCVHSYQVVSDKCREATCTQPGYNVKKCELCNKIDAEIIPALGHDWEVVPGQSATCTENGVTESKQCKRCSEKIEGKVILSNGHDYDRKTHKCKECNSDQSVVTMNSVLNGVVKSEINGGNYFSSERSYIDYTRSITFGYKSDYINKITGTYYPIGIEGIEVVLVYVDNPIYNIEYNEDGKVIIDEREYLIDLYVLSDSVIKFQYKDTDESGLFAMFGLGLRYERGFFLKGGLEKIKFENFDTSDTTDYSYMFNFCIIKDLDLSSFKIKDGAIGLDLMIFNADIYGTITYPNGFPEEYKYKG